MKEAKWTDGKRTVSGRWSYYWPGDFFTIEINQRDRTTGQKTKTIRAYGDHPHWGKFKLIREANCA